MSGFFSLVSNFLLFILSQGICWNRQNRITWSECVVWDRNNGGRLENGENLTCIWKLSYLKYWNALKSQLWKFSFVVEQYIDLCLNRTWPYLSLYALYEINLYWIIFYESCVFWSKAWTWPTITLFLATKLTKDYYLLAGSQPWSR